LQLIGEAHTYKVAVNFCVGKTIANLQRSVYWTKMKEYVVQYIIGFMLCCTNKPSNRNQGLYHPLHVPTRPWESISMVFLGGLPKTMKGHEYIFVVVERIIKMCILMPCKNTINRQVETNKFFEQVWVHFGIPRRIISDRDAIFINTFWTTL
jgi:hypothetical protein